jgi:hypothetical protein
MEKFFACLDPHQIRIPNPDPLTPLNPEIIHIRIRRTVVFFSFYFRLFSWNDSKTQHLNFLQSFKITIATSEVVQYGTRTYIVVLYRILLSAD